MSIKKQKQELKRLQKCFENEANKFHDLTLSLEFITDNGLVKFRQFDQNNHAITIWQYLGDLNSDDEDANGLNAETLYHSILTKTKFGVRGAKFTAFAIIEGEKVELFKKMAIRIGNLFSEKEKNKIDSKLNKCLITQKTKGKPVFAANSNPLALWISFLLI